MLVPLEKPTRDINFSTEKERKAKYFEFRQSPKGQKLEQAMRKAIATCKAQVDKARSAANKVTEALSALKDAFNNPEFKCAEQLHDLELIHKTWEATDRMYKNFIP